MILVLVIALVIIAIASIVVVFLLNSYKDTLREAKNYERGLKMIPMRIYLPPEVEDVDTSGRDERDVVEETLSQAQVMYNIIASTAADGFKTKVYGQKHISFEMVLQRGVISYYVVAPTILVSMIRQAVLAAYPSARLEEVAQHNIFSKLERGHAAIGGEFSLKNDYIYPIASYVDTKRDVSRAILNALMDASVEDGATIQIMVRPADRLWIEHGKEKIAELEGSLKKTTAKDFAKDLFVGLWTPNFNKKEEKKQLGIGDKAEIDAISDKIKYPGYETLIRVVTSSNIANNAQNLLNNIVAAFSLFDLPGNNGFVFTPAKDIDELITAYLFRFFPQATKQNILNSVELSTIFHLPTNIAINSSNKVERQHFKEVEGPSNSEGGLFLGINEYKNDKKKIYLDDTDRNRHVYLIGQTGTGKSWLMKSLAYQDMMSGRGFALIDPHGDLAEDLLGLVPRERVEDVIYFDPANMENPLGLNMFEFKNEDEKDFLIQEAINMLYSLYDPGHTGIVGPRLEHIFRNCALLLMSDPNGGTFIDIPKLLVDENFRNSKLRYVKNQDLLDYWTKEFPASQRSSEAGEIVSWVVSKFSPFVFNEMMRNIIGQTKSAFDIREVMDNNKILIVNLSKGRMGMLNSRLLGMIFVMKFQAAAMSRADTNERDRKDFSLYVDEFQNFATDSFETILSEARKYKLSLIIGNQFMTQLKDNIREAILGNVGTIISGRLGITDAELMERRFRPTFEAEDLTRLPNYHWIVSVMIKGVPSAPFTMVSLSPPVQINDKLKELLKRLSASKYARSRSEVNKEIESRTNNNELYSTTSKDNLIVGNRPINGGSTGSSFLDSWIKKRSELAKNSFKREE